MSANPFLDKELIRTDLYGSADRLADRSRVLMRAKTYGPSATATLVSLADKHADAELAGPILDVGCGNGSSAIALAAAFSDHEVTGIDQSQAVLAAASNRAASARIGISTLVADFHALPIPDEAAAIVVAAFCLYHAPDPAVVLTELARCVAPGGLLITATKSADSYRELDEAVAASGMDPGATSAPSLYETYHSDSLEGLIPAGMTPVQVLHEVHRFAFTDAKDLTTYILTIPKYQITEPDLVAAKAKSLKLPLRMSSTVSYLVARRMP